MFALSPAEAGDSRRARAIRVMTGIFAGFVLLVLVDAGAIALTVPLPGDGLPLRLAHHLFDAAETIALGGLGAAAAYACFARLPRRAAAAVYAAAATAIVYPALGESLRVRVNFNVPVRFEKVGLALFIVVVGVSIPTAHLLADGCSRRPRLRLAAAAAGIGGMAVDHHFFTDDYFGVHAVVAWGAATFAGASIAPLVERAGCALLRARAGRTALGATAALAIFGLCFPPSNAVRHELFRQPCAVAPWVLAATVWRAPSPRVPAPASPWLRDRSTDPPVPPTSPRLLPPDAVVVLITVDARRADALADPENDASFPTLTAMKRRGAVFTRATAAGSQTAFSLTTLFSGRYASELRWRLYGEAPNRFRFPSADPSPRFPQILSDHGVATVDFASVAFLDSAFGVARGFREESVLARAKVHARAKDVIDPLVARLERADRGPLFLFTHLMEPHDPYNRGRQDGTPRERYLSEIAVADAQLARVVQTLEQGFGERWVLFVSADHGEAFGEHESFQHGKTLYEELIHVPLMALGPRITARTLEQRVGLVDLGPTILDLFGVETPAAYDGRSLAPLLAGRPQALTRPLLAECRLRRSLIRPDGLEVIDDPRRKVVEAYDLSADPGETRNLFGRDPARVDPALVELRAFFAAHAMKDDDAAPYKN